MTVLDRRRARRRDRHRGADVPSSYSAPKSKACYHPHQAQHLEDAASSLPSSSSPSTSTSTSSPSPSSSQALLSLLQAPDDLRFPEECISIVHNYAIGAWELGLWGAQLDRSTGVFAPSAELTQWNGLTSVATMLLQRRTTSAFRVLQICFDRYKSLLLSHTPWLFVSTYAFVLRTSRSHPELARCFLRYARDLARIVKHPPSHPYCRLLDAMCRMGPARMETCAADLLESCLAAIQQTFGPDGSDMAHMVVYATDACVSSGLLTPDAARSKLQSLLAKTKRTSEDGRSNGGGNGGGGIPPSGDADIEQRFIPGVQLSMVRANYWQGNRAEAQRLMRQVPSGLPEWAFASEIMSLVYEAEERPNAHARLLRTGHRWGAYIKEIKIVNPWVLSPLVDFHVYIERFADTNSDAKRVREDFETGMEILCEMVCEINLNTGVPKGEDIQVFD